MASSNLTLSVEAYLFDIEFVILESLVPENHKWKHFLGNCCRVVYYAASLCTLQSKHSKSFPKKTCSEKVSYIFSKKPLIFWKRKSQKTPYISGNGTFLNFPKRNFFIFRQKYIQNPSIFRTRSIFRTLVYLEPKTYSEHCQKIALSYISRNGTFWYKIKKVFVFRKKELSSLKNKKI